MSEPISRRDFLKVTGTGAAISAVLIGCDPVSRAMRNQPFDVLSETSRPGKSFIATTCGECPLNCGLIANVHEGLVHNVEGNPDHPVNHGRICRLAQAGIQKLYHPNRMKWPGKQTVRGPGNFQEIQWEDAVNVIADVFRQNKPGEIAFLLGMFPDHLADLAQRLAGERGSPTIMRYTLQAEFDGTVTLIDAAQKVFGASKVPFFDVEHTDFVLSFGANLESTMRQETTNKGGYLVQFESHRSPTAAHANEWFRITPGSEQTLALALAKLVCVASRFPTPPGFRDVDVGHAAAASGVSEENLQRIARLFWEANRKLAIPGGVSLGHTHGAAAAEAVLALNILAGNLGREGGIFLTPGSPLHPDLSLRPNTLAEINSLVERLQSGQIKTLFIHGCNPVRDLPKKLCAGKALQKTPRVISFSSFLDETALSADYIFPDHTPLESWGYQVTASRADRPMVAAIQPVVRPVHNTRSTIGVLLAAAQAAGGVLKEALPFSSEVDFLQHNIAHLMDHDRSTEEGYLASFWESFQRKGGWWGAEPELHSPASSIALDAPFGDTQIPPSNEIAEYRYFLLPLLSPIQNSRSTVKGYPPATLHPQTARQAGVHNGERAKISSPTGEIEAIVCEDPSIHPNVIAIPLEQSPGYNPLNLLEIKQNEAGGLAFGDTFVKIS